MYIYKLFIYWYYVRIPRVGVLIFYMAIPAYNIGNFLYYILI